jgi:hypothetical protein
MKLNIFFLRYYNKEKPGKLSLKVFILANEIIFIPAFYHLHFNFLCPE